MARARNIKPALFKNELLGELAIDFDKPSRLLDVGVVKSVVSFTSRRRNFFKPSFPSWLVDNFAIWKSFESEANALWSMGRRHYSARTIGEFLRHSTALREASSEFKLNDHVWPDCARLYMLLYPEREGFFELRGRH